ncbi:MAG: hypothetical protein A2X36_06605 [Elusimicrobia bacterium GWA2_69_24]|nr:MAG: hypothetical protein A2X36_06605 [Elusimicrobia bacterium GWA2_69_24]HBL17964.1 hypothetical protein [Elusimicrobiota bacterium]
MNLKLNRLDPRRFADFERILSGKEFGGCFCAVWTSHDAGWEDRCRNHPEENLAHTRSRVAAGDHVGYLAYREADGAVVGWTAAGPKTAFPLLKQLPGSRLGPCDESVWAIGCLAVPFEHRGRGYARDMVKLLIEEARLAGAKTLEAYPAEPESEEDSYRAGRGMLEALGFVVVDREAAETKPAPAPAPEPVPETAPSDGGAPASAVPEIKVLAKAEGTETAPIRKVLRMEKKLV